MTNTIDGRDREFDPRPFNLHLRLPPVPRSARTAREALSAFALFHNVEPADVENMTFALGEALANAIERAGDCEEIEVGLAIDPYTVIVTVGDQGPGFKEPPGEAAAFPDGSAESERGIAIMQRCTDFFNVRTLPGGTQVTLGRYRRNRQQDDRFVSRS